MDDPEKPLNFIKYLADTLSMNVGREIIFRKIGAFVVDFTIEFSGGMLGSYFGAMLAALVTVMNQDVNPQMMQSSIKSGFGLGFVFWVLGVSFVNRVLIQGISRASIGKKIFKLELVSEQNPLTWSRVVGRWLFSMGSLSVFGAGYVYALFQREGRTFHDLLADTDVVPSFESSSMEIEVREIAQKEERALQLMIISNIQAERPTASVIRLPLKDQTAAGDASEADSGEKKKAA